MTTLTFRSATSSPYAVVARSTPDAVDVQNKRSLLTMSRLAEAQAMAAPVGAVILAVLQEAKHYTPRTERQYRALAARGVQVALFAHGWSGSVEAAPNLRLVGLAADDAARDEWDVLVCTPTRRFGFVSIDQHIPVADEMDRAFGWLTAHDPEAIGRAAEALLLRVPTAPVRVPALLT